MYTYCRVILFKDQFTHFECIVPTYNFEFRVQGIPKTFFYRFNPKTLLFLPLVSSAFRCQSNVYVICLIVYFYLLWAGPTPTYIIVYKLYDKLLHFYPIFLRGNLVPPYCRFYRVIIPCSKFIQR